MRISWEVAPAARIALTAACTESAHGCKAGRSCGSFMTPNCRNNLSVQWFLDVHKQITYDDVWGVCILGGKLRPQAGKLGVGRSTLIDDLSIPASIVVL